MSRAPDVTSAGGRIQWAFDFIAEDLGALRDGDWANIRAEIALFVGGEKGSQSQAAREGGGFIALPDSPAEELTAEEIGSIQAETRALLQATVAHVSRVYVVPAEGREAQAPPKTSVAWGLIVFGAPTTSFLCASGAPRDLFLTRLTFLLAQKGVDNVRRCPECGRGFWRVGRKEYCGRKCTNRAVFRAWSKTTKKGRTRSKREVQAARERREHHRRQAKLAAARGTGAKAEKGVKR